MGFIGWLKALLGIGSRRPDDPTVRIDRDRDLATEVERAVKDVSPPEVTSSATARPADGSTEFATSASSVTSATSPTERAGGNDGPEAGDDSVDRIAGIGVTYPERLATEGVETIEDLAAADAAGLADATGIGQGRIEKWIERAQARTPADGHRDGRASDGSR